MKPQRLSLERKFLIVMLVTSGAAMIASVAATTLYDGQNDTRLLFEDAARSAAFVADESARALATGDDPGVAHTLEALRADRDVLEALVTARDGRPTAQYVAGGPPAAVATPILERNGYRFLDDRLAVRRPVVFDGKTVGSVYVELDVGRFRASAHQATIVAVATTAGALALVVVLSWYFRPRFSGPIVRLAATAREISRDKNYTLRADIDADDEVATLIEGFNEMLDEIQARDDTLQKHREELEREMAVRTAELRDVNARLHDSESRMRAIIEGTSAVTGSGFFDALAVTLSRALNVRWLLISTLAPGGRVRAQSFWDGTRLLHEFTYDLRGMPAQQVLAESFVAYRERVGELFPATNALTGWKVQSYVGVALRSCDGTLVGILEAFHDEPMNDLPRHGSLLRVCASRAAAELERILVEEELYRSEARTRAILDSAADAIVTITASGVVDTLNPAAEAMFGARADELRGTSAAELMRVPGDEEANRRFTDQPQAVLSAFVGRRGEIEGVRRDGRTFPINVVVTQTEAGAEGGYTAIMRDVSRERELDRMKSDFVSTVSHEIRTPLSCIISSAKILRAKNADQPEVADKFAGIIIEEGQRLSRLINDLLELAKLDTGGLSWTFGETNPGEVLEQVASLFHDAAANRGLELRVDVAADVAPVTVDRAGFIQVLEKLIGNAMKFTPAGGRICLSAQRDGDGCVRIGVDDTGVGIDARYHEAIFERFKQIGDVLTDRPQGSGLGLPICREIVESFGGRIWVESAPGEGSSFRFTLPIAVKDVAPTEHAVAATPAEVDSSTAIA